MADRGAVRAPAAGGNGPRRVRLADVAELAGTSKPIASRILNEDPRLSVSDALRARVRDAAKQLNYRPHAAARGLRSLTAGALGLVIPDLTNTIYATMVRGAFKRAAQRDYAVLLTEDLEDGTAGVELPVLVSSGRIDGLMIATAASGSDLPRELARTGIPHVFLNRAVRGSGRNAVMDDAAATRLALDHLAELGHRRVAHIAGPPGIDPATRRRRAFGAHARRLGLDAAVIRSANLLQTGGAEATRALLRDDPEITAIFASSVMQAAGVLSEAWRSGRGVPEDLSVIAYADSPLAAALVPPLTAVEMPLERLGGIGVDLLLEQLAGAAPHDAVVDDAPRVVLRASTGPAPSADRARG
ncbi:LacI family DNA-binding transcriptional regulator [Conexibacter sp. CPCC 206217]|uniref:LacI family DNA-binding transcriptional regulator n=1 Tax=Conexibacter sp. CPCC 206217 TaxID=3064574 RepID=UPI002716B497|nr:LacI family DNA-binding transcriptional regulator [Conexibacter sp. CPCC 206217]MDO8208784.1 LacI family DNA-binding transcriptional regulator [Conexibacter sp. CPCC 206217]